MLNNALIVSSPTCEVDKTQTSVVYLASMLKEMDIEFEVLDLSGEIEYFDPPKEFLCSFDSKYWLSSRIFYEAQWLDRYFPNEFNDFDTVCYSSFFSIDLLVHGRHALNQKMLYPNCKTIIGGAAVSRLNDKQLSVIEKIFDYVYIGDLKNTQPNYSLIDIKPFVTVYTGQGCNWGKCRFCNSGALKYCPRSVSEICNDFEQLSYMKSKIEDVMLSSDSFTKNDLMKLLSKLEQKQLNLPYNIMLRGEKWVSKSIGELLCNTGCTDVFVGAEALDDNILKILNKGVIAKHLINAIKNLSMSVKVIMGLILFIPGVTEKQLDKQLFVIEKLLPYLDKIEPEILSVLEGTEFANNPAQYNIELWQAKKAINDSWCYGLSPDVPWAFSNSSDVMMWFKYYDKLRCLIKDFVEPHYWDSIDYIRENRF